MITNATIFSYFLQFFLSHRSLCALLFLLYSVSVYTCVGYLFWLQSTRNHVLSDSINVGDTANERIQYIDNDCLWQTNQHTPFTRFPQKNDSIR